MTSAPRGCFCRASSWRIPGLVLLACIGILGSWYLVPPKQLLNRLSELENEPAGRLYPDVSLRSNRWDADYWSAEMPMGRLLNSIENKFSRSLLALLKDHPDANILYLHSSPSHLCNADQPWANHCFQMPISSTYDKTAAPYRLDYPSNSFDAIIYQGVLVNSLDISRMVFEAKRLLKPHGIFLSDGINRNLHSWTSHVLSEKILDFQPTGHHNWRMFVNQAEIERVLSAYNFGLFQTDYFTSSLNVLSLIEGMGFLNSIDIFPSQTPSQLYVICAVNLGG